MAYGEASPLKQQPSYLGEQYRTHVVPRYFKKISPFINIKVMKNITATLVCIGKFTLFALARELLKEEMLEHIFSGYPSWKLRDEDIPAERLKTFPWLQTPYMAFSKWGLLGDGWFQKEFAWLAHETLDKHAAKHLSPSEILFALSGSGLRCGQEAEETRGEVHLRPRFIAYTLPRGNSARGVLWMATTDFPGSHPRKIAKEEAEYQAADIITVPSSFAYRSFLEMGIPESKLCKVPYGVDVRRFSKVADPATDCFDVLFVGQVSFRKGVPDLIDAFGLLKHRRKRLRLVGGMRPEMKRYLKRNPLQGDVEFLGHIPRFNSNIS